MGHLITCRVLGRNSEHLSVNLSRSIPAEPSVRGTGHRPLAERAFGPARLRLERAGGRLHLNVDDGRDLRRRVRETRTAALAEQPRLRRRGAAPQNRRPLEHFAVLRPRHLCASKSRGSIAATPAFQRSCREVLAERHDLQLRQQREPAPSWTSSSIRPEPACMPAAAGEVLGPLDVSLEAPPPTTARTAAVESSINGPWRTRRPDARVLVSPPCRRARPSPSSSAKPSASSCARLRRAEARRHQRRRPPRIPLEGSAYRHGE